jgi:hypothetical protein
MPDSEKLVEDLADAVLDGELSTGRLPNRASRVASTRS